MAVGDGALRHPPPRSAAESQALRAELQGSLNEFAAVPPATTRAGRSQRDVQFRRDEGTDDYAFPGVESEHFAVLAGRKRTQLAPSGKRWYSTASRSEAKFGDPLLGHANSVEIQSSPLMG